MAYNFNIDGKDYEVPSFKEIPTGALRKARHATDDMDRAFTILELTLGTDSEELAVLDGLTVEAFGEWVSGWTQGASVGESSSSAS